VTVTDGAGFHTLLEVGSAAADIAYFVVTTPISADVLDPIGIDDLSFTFEPVERPTSH